MSPVVNFAELLDAYEWVSSDTELESEAYVCRTTGKVLLGPDPGELESDLPENVTDESLYVAVPHKNDLELGKSLVFRFVGERLPEVHDRMETIFSRRGAYGQFKSLLEGVGLLGAWHEYEAQAVESALREWALENELRLNDGVSDEG